MLIALALPSAKQGAAGRCVTLSQCPVPLKLFLHLSNEGMFWGRFGNERGVRAAMAGAGGGQPSARCTVPARSLHHKPLNTPRRKMTIV